MARASFDGSEIDANLKIENGVRRTLKSNTIATVRAKAIEKDYDLYDEQRPSVQLSLDEKCRDIAKRAGADSFEIRDQEVWFRKT